MELVISPFQLRKAPWRLRNKLIAEMMEPNKSVLDIGCGAKNLQWYYRSYTDYLGIDGLPIEEVDLVLDLNSEWQTNIEPGWDYAVNSGILEFVDFPDKLLQQQLGLANEYIFTWWQGKGHGRMNNDSMQTVIEQWYNVIDKKPWGPQMVFKCVAK